MTFQQSLARIRARGAWTELPGLIPFARMLNVRAEVCDDALSCHMPFDGKLIGNPILPALHGGSVGGFLECAGILHLLWATDAQSIPKVIGVSVDYLRSSRAEDTHASTHLVKLGKRVSNLRIEAWQSRRDQPVVIATVNVLMR